MNIDKIIHVKCPKCNKNSAIYLKNIDTSTSSERKSIYDRPEFKYNCNCEGIQKLVESEYKHKCL